MFRKAEDHLQLPGRYTDHGLCKKWIRRYHFPENGTKSLCQKRCRIQTLRTSFTPDAGTGIFKDSQFCGVGDNVGVFKENDGINHKPD